MKQKPLDIIVLAAGRGSRLRLRTPKPLLPLAAEPLITHVLTAAKGLRPRRIIVVVSDDSTTLQNAARINAPSAEFVIQSSPRGTADAARCGIKVLKDDGIAMLLCADTPLLTTASLSKMRHNKLVLLGFNTLQPSGYGRIARATDGAITAVIEEKDASPAHKKITEVFAGVISAPTAWLKSSLAKIQAHNAAKEFYLTDLVSLAYRQQQPPAALMIDESEAAGINTLAELAAAESLLRQRRAAALMARGVCITDPLRIELRQTVKIAAGAVIDINTILQNTTIARDAYIGAHCVICDSKIGAGARIEPFSHLCGATIKSRCVIGPFARLRPQTIIKTGSKIGNFVEIKNSVLSNGVKVGHLSYLGDATIGANSNIGAGVITCNYDGRKKHQTKIGADTFIGSDSQLIAPVEIGRGAYIGAGTTLTHKAPAKSITTSRVSQKSRPRSVK